MARVPQFDANYSHCSDLPLILPNGSNPWASHHVKQTTGTSDTHGWVKEPDIVCKKTATTSDEQRLHMPVTAWMVVSCNVGSAAHAFLRVAPKRRKGRSPSGTSWRISSRFAQESSQPLPTASVLGDWAPNGLFKSWYSFTSLNQNLWQPHACPQCSLCHAASQLLLESLLCVYSLPSFSVGVLAPTWSKRTWV